MKLVDILARELTEWPAEASHACMTEEGLSFTEGGAPAWIRGKFSILHSGVEVLWLLRACTKETYGLQECEEHLVSHGEWESARAAYLLTQQPAQDPELSKIGKSMTKANKDGWIRHRGGKCPVETKRALVDVRLRDGFVNMGTAESFDWGHDGVAGDIMAWKASKTEAKGEPVSQHESPPETSMPSFDPVSLRQQWESLGHEIKSNECSIKATQEVIAGLVERQEAIKAELKAAGFLIYAEVDPVKVEASEDMSDPKNWREGDVFTITSEGTHGFKVGHKVRMHHDDGSDMKGYEDYDDVFESKWIEDTSLKFHSRR